MPTTAATECKVSPISTSGRRQANSHHDIDHMKLWLGSSRVVMTIAQNGIRMYIAAENMLNIDINLAQCFVDAMQS